MLPELVQWIDHDSPAFEEVIGQRFLAPIVQANDKKALDCTIRMSDLIIDR